MTSFLFLSTLSLRRATASPALWSASRRYFYPRSPCGERLSAAEPFSGIPEFLSTLSLRRATTWARGSRVTYVISIHALLAESDRSIGISPTRGDTFLSTLSLRRATGPSGYHQRAGTHFYPRSPCGERPVHRRSAGGWARFLSTLSLRRATLNMLETYTLMAFLSTLSLRRATCADPRHCTRPRYFYPRSPCGERRVPLRPASHLSMYFYPRSPCGERRSECPHTRRHDAISIHALLAESDQDKRHQHHERGFLSTLSLRRATLIRYRINAK